MRCYLRRLITFLGLVICMFGFLTWIWFSIFRSRQPEFHFDIVQTIIWWNGNLNDYDEIRVCGRYACNFSGKREYLQEANAILFYGSALDVADWPIPRLPVHLWGLLHEESPRNLPLISHDVALQHFNFTSTFSRYSDLPLTTFYLPNMQDLISQQFMLPIAEKSYSRIKKLRSSVVFLQTDCDTSSGREDYVRQLMNYIEIDSFGGCLNNRQLPQSLQGDYLNNLYSPTLLKFFSGYKFIISYENGVCDDYITEKFWRPLIVGSIPVYFGSPTIRDWAPNNKSVIYIDDFESPQKLAEYLLKLDRNDTEYLTYLNHKYNQLQPIENKRLLTALLERPFAKPEDNKMDIFRSFECYICKAINLTPKMPTKVADGKHYNCPKPNIYPPMNTTNLKSDWPSIWEMGKCEARVLDYFLQRNEKFKETEYQKRLEKESTKCF